MVIIVTLQRESLIPHDQPAQIQLISRNSNFKNESRVYYHFRRKSHKFHSWNYVIYWEITGWEISWMWKLDLSVEKQHLLNNQRIEDFCSQEYFTKTIGFIFISSHIYLSLPSQIILITELCYAGNNLIFADYVFIFSFFSIQSNNSPIIYCFDAWYGFTVIVWTLTCKKNKKKYHY